MPRMEISKVSPEDAQEADGDVAYGRIFEGGPDGHIVKAEPGAVIDRHYHTQNQFQVVLEGSCELDGETLEPYDVHYTDAETAYGPIVAGDDGLVFMSLREEPAGYHPVDEGESALSADEV